MRYVILVLIVVGTVGCRTPDWAGPPDPQLERMIEQPKALPYGASAAFGDGRSMRAPPEGTVARDAEIAVDARTTGMSDGAYVEHAPIALDRAALARGREHFEVFCAACHGLIGDGTSIVARRMESVAPRDLTGDRVRAYPLGRIFRVMSDGYGLMPSYAAQLTIDERWAVAAYVRALQLSAHAELATLPTELAARARELLP